MASPNDRNVNLDKYDDKKYSAYVMVDLNWFLSTFLGPLFSPASFLKDPEICRNGYVSTKYLEAAFREFHLKKTELVQILDCYQVNLSYVVTFYIHGLDRSKNDLFHISCIS